VKKSVFAAVFALFAASLGFSQGYGGNFDIVASVRPEFRANSAVAGIGLSADLGMMNQRGLYFGLDFGGGAVYYGADFNAGLCVNRHGYLKNLLGGSVGYWNTLLHIYTIDENNGNKTFRETAANVSFIGVFWKLMAGRIQNNFDVTNKILLGYKYFVDDGGYVNRVYPKLNVTYSFSVGYTFCKKTFEIERE